VRNERHQIVARAHRRAGLGIQPRVVDEQRRTARQLHDDLQIGLAKAAAGIVGGRQQDRAQGPAARIQRQRHDRARLEHRPRIAGRRIGLGARKYRR